VHILLMEEDMRDYLRVRRVIDGRFGVRMDWAPNYEKAMLRARKTDYDVYLVGYYPKREQQEKFLLWLHQWVMNTPIILLVREMDRGEISDHKVFINSRRSNCVYKEQITWSLLNQVISCLYGLIDFQKTEKVFQTIFNHAFQFMGLLDAKGTLLEINTAALNFAGTSRELVIGLPLWETPWAVHSLHIQAQFRAAITVAAQGQSVRHEIEIYGVKQKFLPLDFSLTPILNAEGSVVWLLAEGYDLSDRKALEEQLAQAALHDQLTELPNRYLFIEHLELAMARAKNKGHKIAVLFVDLDRFKVINESLGHDMGDWLLMEIAERLKDCLEERHILARSGGDDFMILLDELTDSTEATRLASRINKELARPFSLEGHEVIATTSIGIAYSIDQDEATELLRDADTAMYRAKARGGSCYAVFDSNMHVQAISRLEMESDLHSALEQKNFELFYQPQIALPSEKISGVEALIRLRHPTKGLISPDNFIPVLEDTGLISTISEWTLRTACHQLKAWLGEGLPIHTISVNLSACQFRNRHLARIVARAVEESGLPFHRLEVELTESILLEDKNVAVKTLHYLKDMGVRVTIDDFGTGYASLNYLRRFPANSLKIDKSFIQGVIFSPEDAAITVAIIDMAHALGLTVIAEGVETIEQRDFLRDYGCDGIQGYFYAQPMDKHKFLNWATQYSRILSNTK
jgi:diguanylate cyclase (GGDEF)-like protein/PAS domain S-box-containing protein